MQPATRLMLLIFLLGCQILFALENNRLEATPTAEAEFNTNATIIDLLGKTSALRYAPIMPIDEVINWEIYLPVGYDPAKPAGLMVYISPSDSGDIPSDWKILMNQYNLIWIAANNSGNKTDTRRRITYALLATAVIDRHYSINSKRIYLSGMSGGGRVASMVATEYPTIFKGAIYNSGVNFWGDKRPKQLQQIQYNRYVFVTGRKDFNLEDTKRVFRAYRKAGVDNIKLLIGPFRGHRNPDKRDFGRAINYLDGDNKNKSEKGDIK